MTRALSVCGLLLLLGTESIDARGWTRFRGPNGSGISDATTVPIRWTEEDYNWKVELPGVGHSSPVLWGNRIFLTSGNAQTAQRTVLCLDATDGHVVWRRDYPSQAFRQHGANSYASATPAVDGDGLVVTWSTPEEIVLAALDLDGQESWRRNLGPYVCKHGTGTSPIIVDDIVVLANDQEDPAALPEVYGAESSTLPAGKSFLIALDRRTGKTCWKTDRRTAVAPYATPCVYARSDGRHELIFTSTAYGITALDPATGKVNWELGGLFEDRCVGSPVVAPGLVIAGYGQGIRGVRWVAVRPGNGTEPAVVYDVTQSVPLVPTPVVKDGRLFLWGDAGVVTCLKVSTGEMIWRERVGGSFYGSPVCVNDHLYCIARNGDVVVVAAADEFELLGRVSLGEGSHATPAVSGGVMYLRTQSHLFSLGGRQR